MEIQPDAHAGSWRSADAKRFSLGRTRPHCVRRNAPFPNLEWNSQVRPKQPRDRGPAIINALNPCGSPGMPACSGTHVGNGMETANTLFSMRPANPELGRAMVVLGDGAPNASGPNANFSNDDLKAHAVQQANIADANDISVHTVFYDENDDDTGAAFFESLVRGSGEAHRTPDAEDLPEVFASLCSQIPPRLVR